MRRRFERLSIHRKLVATALLVVATALVAAMVGLLALDLWRFRSAATEDIESLGKVLADNLTAAIVFNETEAAQETLNTLQVRSRVRLACVYGSDGSLFARFVRDPQALCPARVSEPSAWSAVSATIPIRSQDRTVGTVFIERDTSDMGRRIALTAAIGAGMFLLAAGVALLVAHRLQATVSAPIVKLAEAARRVGVEDEFIVGDLPALPDETGELVTAFKAMADRVQRAKDNLVQSNEALQREVDERRLIEAQREDLLIREQAASRLKDQFLAAVSHELRTPLNAIVGWSQVLMAMPPTPQLLDRALASIDRNAKAQTRVIEDLLDISRIATGRFSLQCVPVDLRVVIEHATDVVRPTARAKGIGVTLYLPDTSCIVDGDSERLQQVVWNLLSNAIKFTQPAGTVVVSLTCDGGDAVITVADTGEGISADFLPHVFERFRQFDGSMAREHGGLGLGLAIVKELVEMHGGTAAVASEGAGRGARFTVLLPLYVGPTTLPTADSELRLAGHPSLAGVAVLAVDDNDDALDVAVATLGAVGAKVQVARSGAEALRIWERAPTDVLLCDLAMPHMDGFEVLTRIRELDRRAGRLTPAIALTAHASDAHRDRSIRAGFQQHLSKPFKPVDLIAAVVTALERA